MCGIAGFIYKKSTSKDLKIEVINKINRSLVHRGPNDSGFYIDSETNIALSHTRLAVIDLTSGGSQPMLSSSGRYVISYNGELYNYKDLKIELSKSGINFKSESDTEVLLSCIEKWGIEVALSKFEGMFAFSLFDKKIKQLTLARDRFGEKPLYYGWLKDDFAFGSELKSLKLHNNWVGEIDQNSLSQYLKYSYVPNPNSIYKNIFKVKPGAFITFKIEANECKKILQKEWYSIDEKKDEDRSKSYPETMNVLEELLLSSINNQKVSDVPIGSLLSGGIDSSLISLLMQRDSSKKINTFTIGYNEKIYDESRFAKNIAKHIGSNHHEWIIKKNEIINHIPNMPKYYDEPFADSSQLPTYLVSKFASQKVTVCLTGDAGDELFGGYNRYIFGPRIKSFMTSYPQVARAISKFITTFKPYNWKSILNLLQTVVPEKYNIVNPSDKLLKFNEVLSCNTEYDIYDNLVSTWKSNILINNDINEDYLEKSNKFERSANNFAERMMIADINSYLTDDILVKVDRASMANSLETRVPFLNEKIVSLSSEMPLEMKINSLGQGKRILRDILKKYIPENLINRPKAGFGIPIDDWLRTSLREWASDQLNENKIRNQGLFNHKQIKRTWDAHLKSEIDHHHQIWNILMFQSWLEEEAS